MSSLDTAPLPPRRTPLTVRLALGQLALVAVAFAAIPALALKKTFYPSSALPRSSAPASAFGDDGSATADGADAALASADPMVRGGAIYGQSCAACHQPDGTGLPGVFPPLASSDYLLADPERAIAAVLHGLSGPITVNGVAYEGFMPPMPLGDAEVADVITYVLQSWGNQGPAVGIETVARIRAEGPKP